MVASQKWLTTITKGEVIKMLLASISHLRPTEQTSTEIETTLQEKSVII